MNSLSVLDTNTGSLLDRLCERPIDNLATVTKVRGDLQASNPEESILRNLQWLLNTTQLASSVDLSRWPHIRQSVLNYGVPEFSGKSISGADASSFERELEQAIAMFETRLVRDSIQVQAYFNSDSMDLRSVVLEISGRCVPTLSSANFHLTARIDVESGRVTTFDN